MKSPIHIIATLYPVEGKEGETQFAGSLDPSMLKKTKRNEIEVVLVSVASVPKPLGNLINKNHVGTGSLLLFAGIGEDEERIIKKKTA